MREMGGVHTSSLTAEDRRRNEYLDQVNHAPYFTIFLVMMGVFCLFTGLVLIGAF